MSQWYTEPSRSGLLDMLQRQGVPSLPALHGVSTPAAAVSRLDGRIDALLRAANAVDCNVAPYVWLTRITEAMSADVLTVHEQPRHRYEPVTEEYRRTTTGWQRGIVQLGDEGRWKITVGSKYHPLTRFDVAHEVAHALLYSTDTGVNVRAWSQAGWSEIEEAICNYAARRILVPLELMPDFSESSNIAEFMCEQIMQRFCLPLRAAALRWLDTIVDTSGGVVAVLLWRQYHPFDYHFVHAVLREYSQVLPRAKSLARQLAKQMPECNYEEAWKVWRHVFGNDAGTQAEIRWWMTREVKALTAEFHDALSSTSTLPPDVQAKLTGRAQVWTMRPEWITWHHRPASYFVPVRRGAFRPGTMLEELAGGTATKERIQPEAVAIGALRGNYEVHGYAHGELERGSRFVLQAFRPLPVAPPP